MKERPILFSAPLVRALLDGAKTQTRRLVKPVRGYEHNNVCRPDMAAEPWDVWWHGKYETVGVMQACPYGQPGDRLWVRETWGVVSNDWDDNGGLIDWVPDRPATEIREMPFGQGYYSGHAIYAADGAYEWAGDDDGGGEPRSAWHPSIHMPRAASRILLEVTGVRVERLQEISESDALAEGIKELNGRFTFNDGLHESRTAIESYHALWESINGAGSWDANPWVWVVEFKRVAP